MNNADNHIHEYIKDMKRVASGHDGLSVPARPVIEIKEIGSRRRYDTNIRFGRKAHGMVSAVSEGWSVSQGFSPSVLASLRWHRGIEQPLLNLMDELMRVGYVRDVIARNSSDGSEITLELEPRAVGPVIDDRVVEGLRRHFQAENIRFIR